MLRDTRTHGGGVGTWKCLRIQLSLPSHSELDCSRSSWVDKGLFLLGRLSITSSTNSASAGPNSNATLPRHRGHKLPGQSV